MSSWMTGVFFLTVLILWRFMNGGYAFMLGIPVSAGICVILSHFWPDRFPPR